MTMAANILAWYAAAVIPSAATAAAAIGNGTGSSADVNRVAAQKWLPTADLIREAQQELQGLVDRIPKEMWSGADKDAYAERIKNYSDQLDAFESYVKICGYTMVVASYALAAFAALSMAIGTFLAAIATIALAVAALPIAGQAYYSFCVAAAGVCGTIMTVACKVLLALLSAVAVVLQGGALVEVGVEMVNGSDTAWNDFKHADALHWRDSLQAIMVGGVSFAGLKGAGSTVRGGTKITPGGIKNPPGTP
ncbi:hypothetical protein GCM10010191_44680 [Actinomadura vinacea]|uniref:WXG100 family type VII secretion target n=1 Tax=Actinomadura vinacea TaxID=115336 RepID=A0ABP5WGN6_9ACTN